VSVSPSLAHTLQPARLALKTTAPSPPRHLPYGTNSARRTAFTVQPMNGSEPL